MDEGDRGAARQGLDAFLDGLDYPVFVVTASNGRERAGCLVGFASQVSIEPPRLLVCLSEANRTLRVAQDAIWLAVHLLGSGDHGLAERFGGETGDEVDKFAGVRWHAGPDGVPLLDGVPRRLVGRIVDRAPFGDHVGHVLAPILLESDADGPGPLTFQQVRDVEPGHLAG